MQDLIHHGCIKLTKSDIL